MIVGEEFMRSSRPARRLGAALPMAAATLAVCLLSFGLPGVAVAQDDGASGDPPAENPAEGTPEGAAPDADSPPAAEPPAAEGDVPVNVRLRRLEQKVQSLKERAWRSKARVGMLKEAVLGGGVGARATVVHKNKMGRAFRLVKLVYAIDGTQVYSRADETGKLDDAEEIDIISGPLSPGQHTLSVLMVYRGSGFGPFKYLKKYKYTVRSSHTFTAVEGKATRVDVVGYEKGGATTQLRDRPAVDFRVSSGDYSETQNAEKK